MDFRNKDLTNSSYANSLTGPDNVTTQDKHFLMRYNLVESTFIRLSETNKAKFLHKCIKQIESLDTINYFLSQCTSLKKINSQISSELLTNFVYDNALQDNDRSLDPDTLAKTMEEDINWYTNLPEPQKLTSILNLTRLAGGRAGIKCFHTILERYNTLMYKNAKDNFDQYLNQKKSTPSKDVINSTITEEYNENDPRSIKVKTLREVWEDKINRYKREVEKKSDFMKKAMMEQMNSYVPKKSGNKPETPLQDVKKTKQKNNKTSTPSEAKSFASTSSKPATMEVNYIHLLPIWLILKIFTYLDAKSLMNAQDVDRHWGFAVKMLSDERKIRINLNSSQKTLDLNIDYNCLEENKGVDIIPEKKIKYTYVEQKTQKSIKRGAANAMILRKRKHYKISTEPPLFLKCLQSMVDYYYLPIQHLVTYPRFVSTFVPPLYKLHMNNQKDIDVNFDVNARVPQDDKQEEENATTDLFMSVGSYSTIISESNPNEFD